MAETKTQDMVWDLSDLYASMTDPKIDADMAAARANALAFEARYKPLFQILEKNPAADFPLTDLLRDYKDILILHYRPLAYAYLLFNARSSDESGAFLQKIQAAATELRSPLLFFSVAWNRLAPGTAQRLAADPRVEEDRHYLEKMRAYATHTLGEGEEKIMALKSDTGSSAWGRLFDETLGRAVFRFEAEGKTAEKSEAEILALLHSPDREVRRRASESLAEGLKANSHVVTFVFNTLLADHRLNMKIRHYVHPMDARNLENEIDLASVQNLIESVKKGYPIAWRYYRLKKKLLGLDRLHDYDRFAPLAKDETSIPFEKGREIVISGYTAFSADAGRMVGEFFEKRWIDAEPRKGKCNGAFCMRTTPDLHPYVLSNYTGRLRDVLTLAHELGHGLHQQLASKRVGFLESGAPLTLAETASVFGEMLIFDKILGSEKDPARRLQLICGEIDDHFATVFRQIAMTDFELKCHEAGLQHGELSSEKISDLWIEANAALYGDTVSLSEGYRQGWKYIPHFIHTSFYCYAYAFAQLFVLALYQKYKQDPQGFVPRYFEMLSLGGSRKPADIAAIAGIDLKNPAFWQEGLKLLDNLITEAESLAG